MKVTVIGAGLAGSEAAWQLACRGIPVTLHEMKPVRFSPAHRYEGFAELVCSNSLKANRIGSAAGLLKEEMYRLGSIVVRCARETAVPAGGALAVDRYLFSDCITKMVTEHPLITVRREEVTQIPEGPVIIASGPLTSDGLSKAIGKLLGEAYLSFYDAASPIVAFDSIDMDKAFFAARYGKGEDDYINCPMNREEYEAFHAALISAESVELKEFEQDRMKVYEGCMPVEVLAKRGSDSIRFGPLKPVGLRDPRTGHRPWAVVQLRAENAQKTLYNLVGFQTNLRFPEQKRVFSMIPGLENAEFVRYGVMHRNTYLNGPDMLGANYAMKNRPLLRFAGQLSGVEGYMESTASGLVAAVGLACALSGRPEPDFTGRTILGALARHVSTPSANFQPMNANYGILDPLENRVRGKRNRYEKLSERALEELSEVKRQYEL